MKCDTTNTILTFVLGFLAVLGVIFAVQTMFLTREFRSLQQQALQGQNGLMRVQALLNDTIAYNQKTPSPELTRILQAAQTKPAAK
jgi:Tfp pilus assembly protein PilV